MAKSKIQEALEKKQAVTPAPIAKSEGTQAEELSESAADELKEETQGDPSGKSPDQLIEENLVVLMNLSEKLTPKEMVTAIAHLAVTTLVLKKAIDVLAGKDAQLAQAIQAVAGAHQTAQEQNANIMHGMHKRLQEPQNLPPQAPQAPVQG